MSVSLSLDPVQELITDLVEPNERAQVAILPQHVTVLHGTKSKKQLSKKRRERKTLPISRREYARLGLHALPTHQMKYLDVVPLHHLWKGYVREHLGLRNGATIPKVHDAEYESFSKLLVKTDLHGAKVRVIESRCQTLVGLAGIVVLETKNTIKLIGHDDRIRTIPKSECVLAAYWGNLEIVIFSRHMKTRPAERSVKKVKSFIEPFE